MSHVTHVKESDACRAETWGAGVDPHTVDTRPLSTLQHTATNCNKLQHTRYPSFEHTATHCNTLQQTATHSIPIHFFSFEPILSIPVLHFFSFEPIFWFDLYQINYRYHAIIKWYLMICNTGTLYQ